MADGDIFLVSKTGDTINLNPLLTSNEGVQVVAGLTGFGLPSVEVMYQVGAGDGAKYRGQRALPRDIDLPLHIVGNSRASLRTHVNRLAKALAGECRLQWDDGERLWETKVRRVGGGEYVYGSDTEGRELNLTVTLRAEDPMWVAATGVISNYSPGTSDALHKVEFPPTAFGTVATPPTFKIHGPTLGFKVENHDKTRSFSSPRFVPGGGWVEVNAATGLVVNSEGVNVYNQLAPAPQFFAVSAEQPFVWVTVDRSSNVYQLASVLPLAHNEILNPTFDSGTAYWRPTSSSNYNPGAATDVIAYNSAAKALDFKSFTSPVTTYRVDSTWHSGYAVAGLYYDFDGSTGGFLTAGKRYSIEIHVPSMGAPDAAYATNVPAELTILGGQSLTLVHKSQFAANGVGGIWKTDFVALGGWSVMSITAPHAYTYNPSGHDRRQIPMQVSQVSVTDYGYGYFDGSTPDTASRNHEWTGTPHASKSALYFGTDKANTKIETSLKAKNWLVV